ncbi:MAG: hypothetical protein OQJ89_12275 [Kangiellaceae bacterium]|nr:hypothetical protein [Kangiellaceae bacterium]MCW8997224.1 hypothetical protein [Kangiellaceae bacterium]MCW9017737.1 hypothetical protein [Kangiellaceae bacterium]
MVNIRKNILLIATLAFTAATGAHEKDSNKVDCKVADIKCAKTITSAFSPQGDLWRVWSFNNKLYATISAKGDLKKNRLITIKTVDEKISSRGENRPKIGFDTNEGVYISWAKKREKRFTADIRFIYSLDGGKSFSKPITVNDDGLLAGHSFNEMQVNEKGEVSLIWLDSRHKALAKKSNKDVSRLKPGSSIYFASAKPSKGDTEFRNKELVNQTCQCCRLAFTQNKDNEYSVFWRQIYAENTREFALLTFDKSKSKVSEPKRISYDEWKINGCPHQGGALSIDSKTRYHMAWFNQGEKGKGIFYSYSDDKGNTVRMPTAVGNNAKNAAHPHMLHTGTRVDIVWVEINEGRQELWHQKSDDRGTSFGEAKLLATATTSADRPFVVNNNSNVFVSWQRPKQNHFFKAL